MVKRSTPTTMSSQRIPLAAKVRAGLQILRAHRSGRFSNAEGTVGYHRALLGYLAEYTGVPVGEARVLDLGCGQQAAQTALFHADGARVTGIDAEVPTFRMSPRIFGQTVRQNGLERGFKSLARNLLFDRGYFRELEHAYGRGLELDGLDVRVMDATRMEFADDTFDFIFSMAVFEHIEDPAGAVREVNRVLKPGGMAVITPHLFPSLSGGHNLEWVAPDERPAETVPPWDHLRENRFPVNTYLNRLRLADYVRIMHGGLDVVREDFEREGEARLTEDLARELVGKGYSPEDLTTKTVTFFARKKAATAAQGG